MTNKERKIFTDEIKKHKLKLKMQGRIGKSMKVIVICNFILKNNHKIITKNAK